jgi:hypothetical protein
VSRASNRARRGSRPSRRSDSSPSPSALAPPPIRSAETWRRPTASSRIAVSVSPAGRNPSCETSRRPRNSLKGSSRKLPLPTVRSSRRARSERPPKGSTSSPVERRRAIAFTVKSRRPMSSATVTAGSATISKSRWPGPVLRSARGGVISMPARVRRETSRSRGLNRTPTSCPCTSMSSIRPWGASAARSPPWSTPGTRKSSSACSIPSSSSRTAPPTTYASRSSERMYSRTGLGTPGFCRYLEPWCQAGALDVRDRFDLDERAGR